MLGSLIYILLAFVLARAIVIKDPIERLTAVIIFSFVFFIYLLSPMFGYGSFDMLGMIILIGFIALYFIRGGYSDIIQLLNKNRG